MLGKRRMHGLLVGALDHVYIIPDKCNCSYFCSDKYECIRCMDEENDCIINLYNYPDKWELVIEDLSPIKVSGSTSKCLFSLFDKLKEI